MSSAPRTKTPERPAGWLGFTVAVAGVVLVLALTLMPSAPSPSIAGIAHVDKLFHAGAWGMLALVTYVPFFARRALLCWGALVAFGVLIEAAQGFLPPRGADVWDAVADACGAALALVVVRALPRRAQRALARADLSERGPMG